MKKKETVKSHKVHDIFIYLNVINLSYELAQTIQWDKN